MTFYDDCFWWSGNTAFILPLCSSVLCSKFSVLRQVYFACIFIVQILSAEFLLNKTSTGSEDWCLYRKVCVQWATINILILKKNLPTWGRAGASKSATKEVCSYQRVCRRGLPAQGLGGRRRGHWTCQSCPSPAWELHHTGSLGGCQPVDTPVADILQPSLPGQIWQCLGQDLGYLKLSVLLMGTIETTQDPLCPCHLLFHSLS